MLDQRTWIISTNSEYFSRRLVLEVTLHLPGQVVKSLPCASDGFVKRLMFLFSELFVLCKLLGLVFKVLIQEQAALA